MLVRLAAIAIMSIHTFLHVYIYTPLQLTVADRSCVCVAVCVYIYIYMCVCVCVFVFEARLLQNCELLEVGIGVSSSRPLVRDENDLQRISYGPLVWALTFFQGIWNLNHGPLF